MKCRTFTTWAVLVCSVASLCGCDKIKEYADRKEAADSPPPVPAAEPPLPAQTAAPIPQAAPPRTPELIIKEFLAIDSYRRTDPRLTELAGLQTGLEQIQELDLTSAPISANGLKALTALPELRSLNLTSSPIDNSALAVIPELKKLEKLVLNNAPRLDDQALTHVGKSPTIKELSIGGLQISDQGITPLKEMKQLTVLRLDGNERIMGGHFGSVVHEKGFPNLRELTASGTKIGTYGLSEASLLKNLEIVRVVGAGLPDLPVAQLAKCSKLKILDLSGNPCSDLGVKELNKLKQLEELSLASCRAVTDNSFDFLRTMKQLKRLNVSRTSCTEPNVKLLADKFLKDTVIVFNGQEY